MDNIVVASAILQPSPTEPDVTTYHQNVRIHMLTTAVLVHTDPFRLCAPLGETPPAGRDHRRRGPAWSETSEFWSAGTVWMWSPPDQVTALALAGAPGTPYRRAPGDTGTSWTAPCWLKGRKKTWGRQFIFLWCFKCGFLQFLGWDGSLLVNLAAIFGGALLLSVSAAATWWMKITRRKCWKEGRQNHWHKQRTCSEGNFSPLHIQFNWSVTNE